MSDNKILIKDCIDHIKQLNNVHFHELVQATSGYELQKLNLSNPEEKIVFDTICNAAKNLIKYTKRTKTRYQGNRANDVGKRIEEVFVEELKKTELKPKLLSKSGYPDIRIETNTGKIFFLESKAVSSSMDSTFRSFYYSNGNKIDANGHHLLIAWNITEEESKYWRVESWNLIDLYDLELATKLEFHASNKQLYRPYLILNQE